MTGKNHPKRVAFGQFASLIRRALVVALALGAASPAFAKHKKPHSWTDGTTVESQQTAGNGDTLNPLCASISANLTKRVANMKTLKVSYDKAAAAPPASVKSALEDIFGARQADAKMLDIDRKIKAERKAAEELNEMLRAQRCAQVDIDSALAAQPAQDQGRPVVPKDVPDDLVQTPHRY